MLVSSALSPVTFIFHCLSAALYLGASQEATVSSSTSISHFTASVKSTFPLADLTLKKISPSSPADRSSSAGAAAITRFAVTLTRVSAVVLPSFALTVTVPS